MQILHLGFAKNGLELNISSRLEKWKRLRWRRR
jgi:hypothetical protein